MFESRKSLVAAGRSLSCNSLYSRPASSRVLAVRSVAQTSVQQMRHGARAVIPGCPPRLGARLRLARPLRIRCVMAESGGIALLPAPSPGDSRLHVQAPLCLYKAAVCLCIWMPAHLGACYLAVLPLALHSQPPVSGSCISPVDNVLNACQWIE